MDLRINNELRLTEVRATDVAALVLYLNDRDIYERTKRIPYPYTMACAEQWLARNAELTQRHGRPVNWVVRGSDESLIGGIGFVAFDRPPGEPPTSGEVGYWLGKPFWSRGIMTEALRRLCRHAFDDLELREVTAHAMAGNVASARVLEKCGFQAVGLLPRHFEKGGIWHDAVGFRLRA